VQRSLYGDGLEALFDARPAPDVARAKERLERGRNMLRSSWFENPAS
jgi:hypothetical protein